MKKYLLLILALSTFTFTSCSKDDDNETKNPLIGMWNEEGAVANNCGKSPLEFTETEYKITANYVMNGDCKQSVTTYNYTAKDNTLILKDPNGYVSDFNWKYTVSDNKLTITRDGKITVYNKQ